MKRTILLIFSLITSTITASDCYSQSQEKLYSLMLLNFAKGIHWPSLSSEYFVVGVIDYPPLVPELANTTLRSNIHGKKIKIVEISDLEDVAGCQMVFLPAYKAKLLPELLSNAGTSATLIVSNKTDLARKGGGIDLVLRDGKLTFDINSRSIEQRGLKISTNIRSTGNNVQ